MKKLTIILGIIILATTAFFLFKPQPIGTGTRTKMVYLDRENTFTATTTLENGFVSTSTPTQAGQIVGLDGDGKLPAVDGSNITGMIPSYSQLVFGMASFNVNTNNQFMSPFYLGSNSNPEETGKILIPYNATIQSITVLETENNGCSYTLTARVNGVDKTLPTNINAGDTVSVKVKGNSGSYSASAYANLLIKTR